MPTNKTSRSIVSSTPLNDRPMIYAKFVLFAILLFQQSLISKERTEYSEIKSFLERKDFISSQRKINSLLSDNPSDPELLYLQADTWFQQAESHYKKENYKTANDLYKQVLGIWPNHPILNERISFLSKKNLTDNNQKKEESVIQNPLANHSNINETYIVVNEDISLFKIVSYNQEQDLWKSELSFPMKNPGYSIITLKASEKEKLILLKPIAFGILILSVILTTLSVNLILLAMKTKKSSKGIWSKKKGNT